MTRKNLILFLLCCFVFLGVYALLAVGLLFYGPIP
jgi:hypothetical protein